MLPIAMKVDNHEIEPIYFKGFLLGVFAASEEQGGFKIFGALGHHSAS